jgi:hypothetical protein
MLLESFLKVLTKLITTRLADIVTRHSVLRGHNFGFRAGLSTAEPLAGLRHIMDAAKLTCTPLYLACLDIKHAYDSVPFAAVAVSFRRVGVPEPLVSLLRALEM